MRLYQSFLLAAAAAACSYALTPGPAGASVAKLEAVDTAAATDDGMLQVARHGGPEKGDDKGGKRGGKGGKGRGGHDDGPDHT